MKPNLWIILTLFLFFQNNICWGQTIIHIQDKTYANLPLRLYAYEDLLTHSPKLLANKQVDNNGQLKITVNLRTPQLLYIPIYSFHLMCYAEPNSELLLKLPPLPQLKDAFERLKTYSKKQIPLFVQNKNSLNQAITEYDSAYNTFVKKNFQNLYLKEDFETYLPQITALQKLHTSKYFKNYALYKQAYIAYIAGRRQELLPEYFAHKPLLLQHTAYVSLLRKLATNPAEDFAKDPKHKRLYNRFLAAKNYSQLQKIYKGLANTEDNDFNEHFFIYVMHLGIKKRTIPKKIGSEKLQIIAQTSSNKSNKQLAQNIINSQQSSFQGSKAAAFSLRATNGKHYTEEAIFKTDKPTLLAYFDSSVNNSTSIKALSDLQEKHNNTFKIVVFSSENASKNVPKSWVQFVVPYNSYILTDYHLGRFPYYVLIDKSGSISKQTWQQYLISLGE